MSISPTLRAAARSVYRDLWRASATTFSGAICPFQNAIDTRSYLLTWQATLPYFQAWPYFHNVTVSFLCRCTAFRQKIRKDALGQYSVTDEQVFKNNLKLGREIADFLRKNIVQAERLPGQTGEDNEETYSTCTSSFQVPQGFPHGAQKSA
jgi:hypothetical protein